MSQVHSESRPKFLNGMNIFSAAVILILAGSCIYLLAERSRIERMGDNALQQKQQAIDSIRSDRMYLEADFNAASAKVDQLLTMNAGMNDTLLQKKAVIARLQNQVKAILADQKATRDELVKARNMIYMLNDKTLAFEQYIVTLEKDNSILAGENKLLSRERDNTVARNIALKMAGSVLHASDIRMVLIHERRKGRESEAHKAKKADRIRVMFNIDENRIAESGIKQIYVRIIGPGDKVLQSKQLSGTIGTVNGPAIQYSLLKEVDMVKNKPLKDNMIEWEENDGYVSGEYKVELYNSGYKIGEQSVALK